MTWLTNPKIIGALALVLAIAAGGRFLYISGHKSCELDHQKALEAARAAYDQKLLDAKDQAKKQRESDIQALTERIKKAHKREADSRRRLNEIEDLVTDCMHLGPNFIELYKQSCDSSGYCARPSGTD